ncbi:DEAD/DEAH box helicase [Actinokineospora globicatena]|uniref:DEAD/DEAH box helicase n=1 Tax=Actinokineospora globicatena TaxID=103729 RepID=UPI0020A551DC|nr:DEAD/DEAH box helicase [Actinokineospora globicatena]MCP2304894.1 Superfamily II DNA or RNA helicase, SNF2 family [Actinokineospora globicatena]GLW77725.1 helicase [Actinokineospora globicatena]GLW85606.1 helicase [Actinokineospora globicatena]
MIPGLDRCAATVESADLVAFHGDALPDGLDLGELVLAGRRVAAVRVPIADAVPVLAKARRDPRCHSTAAFWGAVVVVALRQVARGALVQDDRDRLAQLADRMPDGAHVTTCDPLAVVRMFVEAIAGPPPEDVLRLPAGLRLSLRLDTDGSCVPQVHSAGVVVDAAEVAERGDEAARTALTDALHRAARRWPPLGRLLTQDVPDRLALTEAEVGDLLVNATRIGVDVHWPRHMVAELSRRAVIGRTESAYGMATAEWELVLDGTPLTRAEVERLAATHAQAVRLRDQWVLLDGAVTPRAIRPLTVAEALAASITGNTEVDGREVPVVATGWLDELRARVEAPDEEVVEQPDGLVGVLRDYQLRGLRWLARMTRLGLGACLADDMGLGKTITVIALHLHRSTVEPTLVVCPASLMGNWAREIARFAPGIQVTRYHGQSRTLAAKGIVLTTYAVLRRDAARLAGQSWGLVIADEAQHVKNPDSATAKALRTVPGQARVALTGTPVENTLTDLWALLDWTTPGLLGSRASFRVRWAEPVAADPEVAAVFARLIRPFLLRRRKSDPGIVPELPPKTETDHPVPLTREQAGLYTAAVRSAMVEIRGAEGMARRGHVLRLLTSLKQICNHPAQYLRERDGRLTARSGKLTLLDELLDTILAEDSSVLVFTQYVSMARLLERHLHDRKIPSGFLHGATPVPQRERLVDHFTTGAFGVFLLSLKAAGTGLNLTRADHVIHYDRWWNPAVEDQATDRAYRIGQTRPVQVHRLIAEGTVEHRIAELLRTKRHLADSILTPTDTALTELSDTDLTTLIELRR